MRFAPRNPDERVELTMTPMIDVVFQLLIFFTLTFRFAAPEGNFSIKMPLVAMSSGEAETVELPPIKVRLTAGPGGRLAGIVMGARPVADFPTLRAEVRAIIGDDPGPGALETTEVEFDCDYHLKYEYVIAAITAVSGYIDPETGQIQRIVEKINFAPPRAP
ncbi:MAG: biopolymer transporter ExbD [Thermoguttaceae bacterium]|nr:biopolymer transporter ExbD [Thermoguttaceae bacterium]